jgi:hypothetical protein
MTGDQCVPEMPERQVNFRLLFEQGGRLVSTPPGVIISTFVVALGAGAVRKLTNNQVGSWTVHLSASEQPMAFHLLKIKSIN